MRANRIPLVLFLVALCPAVPAFAVVEAASADKVRALVDQVTQAQSCITSLRFKCSEDHESHMPGGVMNFHDEWEVWQRGPFRSAARDSSIQGFKGPQHLSSRAVLNDQFFALMINPSQSARQYLHESID